MRHRNFLPLILGAVMLFTGCAATNREWEVWRAHPTHYATTNHLAFSMRNMVGAAPQVTPEMMDQAKGEGWWGRNTPLVTPRANVAGKWEGTWSGYGMSRTLRGGVAKAMLTLDGGSGQGRLVLMDARLAEGVPLSLRENSSFGAPIELSGPRPTCGSTGPSRAAGRSRPRSRCRGTGSSASSCTPARRCGSS